MQVSIQDVKQRHEARLMAMPGVVAVGIARNTKGESVIVVSLDGERPKTRQQLPQRLEGYPLRVDVIGKIRSQ